MTRRAMSDRPCLVEVHHGGVEGAQLGVAQVLGVRQVPPPPAVLVRPPVALPREVHPLRVPELVPHRVGTTLYLCSVLQEAWYAS